MPSPAEVKSLYRAFLREGAKFPNYNIREYVRRKAREDFRAASREGDQGVLAAVWSAAQEQLNMVQRQAIVYSSYARKQRNVMDIPEPTLRS